MHNGQKIERQSELANHCVDYFSTTLGITESPFAQDDLTMIRRLTKFRCESWLKDLLQADVTESEIKNEVMALPKNKCSGPDGFNAEFFIKSWAVVGGDVVSTVREFFDGGYMLKQLNATAIALIPKFQGADQVKDFRPISLCNVIYKIISKILPCRLQLALPRFISSSQSAFVRGRLLVENVTLATELVKGFGTKSSPSRGPLKVDLTKAFDTVRWDFIIAILEAAEFPLRYINRTVHSLSFSGRLQFISSVIYSLINFWMGAFVLPKRCLREITKLCTRFLWAGDITKVGKAKVSWKALCLPKSEGGLGIRDLYSWNKVITLKLI